MITPRPDVAKIIKRLHEMVDDLEPSLRFSLDNGMFTLNRVTFSDPTGKPAYTLVVGFDAPDHELSDPEYDADEEAEADG